MKETLEAVYFLERKLKRLLENYAFLKEENEILLRRLRVLQDQVDKNRDLLAAQNKKYDLLRIAKTIRGDDGNTKATKLKINTLIREIDKCIVQLNG